ncbi:uncharacterized protein LOC110976135 isoform X3 [Acanthaster planci]|uniref:Uncharacterized protein LOC110976135 isoform X3 n=1 Tax=Acanthaster planci TaxID=133434 RepID=A0A8B7XX75_ACAPL|nr:uncharacterized protein LOC110976135 isoform X3 [Acanthaster planci]
MSKPTIMFMEVFHAALFCAFLLGRVAGQIEACQVCTCTPAKVVDCTGKGLTSLPPGIPYDTIALTFSQNNLTRIKKHTFMNLTRLRTLRLQFNQISTIEPGGFIGLSGMLDLHLGSNRLEKLDADTMLGINGGFLFHLDVACNKLKSLSPLTFSGVATPYRIVFRDNEIVEIPPRLMYQKNKELVMFSLVFTNNRIERVAPDAFEGLKYIHTLYFASNRIASLPENLFINTTIRGLLDLSSNMLTGLPEGLFKSLGRLRYLYLHNNMLSSLSKNMFGRLHSLRQLLISDNPIMQMDDRLFSETQLVNLYIYNTQLKTIGDRPFVTRNNTMTLVSLYANDIEVISDSVWQDVAPNCKIFVDNTIRRAPHARSDVEIVLAGSGFVQSINVSSQTGEALSTSGFSCVGLPNSQWECTPCRQGNYGGPWMSCRACPPGGFFQNRTGQVARKGAAMNCLSCNNGTYVTPENHPGRNIGDCVVCPSGTEKCRHAGFRACPCLSNYYRRDRFRECFPCPLEGINCSGEYQHLLPGFWWTWDWGSIDNYQSYKRLKQCYLRLKETPSDVYSDRLAETKSKCYLVVTVLLFITYPGLSSAILTLLPTGCDDFYLDENNKIRVHRLRSDYSIDCDTIQHVTYNHAAEVSLCYVIGFPSVLLVMLWMNNRRRRKKANDSSSSLVISNSSDQTPVGAADQQTDHDNQRHHVDDVRHGTCRNNDCAVVASQNDSHETTDAAHSNQPLSLPSISSSVRSITWETFLCENYKEQFWYWEIVELTRKILQVLFVLLFGAEDHFTLFATIVLSVSFLVVHAYVKPMKDVAEHRLQMCSLASIFLNLLAASLLLLPSEGGSPSEGRKEVLAVFLVLLNLTIVAFVAGSAIWSFATLVFKTACCQRAVRFIGHVCRQLRLPRRYWVLRRHPSHHNIGERHALLSGRPGSNHESVRNRIV